MHVRRCMNRCCCCFSRPKPAKFRKESGIKCNSHWNEWNSTMDGKYRHARVTSNWNTRGNAHCTLFVPFDEDNNRIERKWFLITFSNSVKQRNDGVVVVIGVFVDVKRVRGEIPAIGRKLQRQHRKWWASNQTQISTPQTAHAHTHAIDCW